MQNSQPVKVHVVVYAPRAFICTFAWKIKKNNRQKQLLKNQHLLTVYLTELNLQNIIFVY